MGVFGQQAIYTPRGGAAIIIPDAVFDAESSQITTGDDGSEIVVAMPTLGIRAAALGSITAAQNDTVLITATGVAYIVKSAVPDGHGHIRLHLMRKVA